MSIINTSEVSTWVTVMVNHIHVDHGSTADVVILANDIIGYEYGVTCGTCEDNLREFHVRIDAGVVRNVSEQSSDLAKWFSSGLMVGRSIMHERYVRAADNARALYENTVAVGQFWDMISGRLDLLGLYVVEGESHSPETPGSWTMRRDDGQIVYMHARSRMNGGWILNKTEPGRRAVVRGAVLLPPAPTFWERL